MTAVTSQSSLESRGALTKAPAAILIVHGGEPNPYIRWLSLCVSRIRQLTRPEDYHLFIWNDRPADSWVRELVAEMNNASLVTVSASDPCLFPDESFLHGDRLQRLYDRSRAAGYRFVVTMDTDAHPLQEGWLDRLKEPLRNGAALAGVWQEESPDTIDPYVHPCCLATRVDFIERHGLRFDEIGEDRHGCLRDTLCHFTTCAIENHYQVERLRRSNRNEFHPTIGGVYGDLIYHHGGGSRLNVRFRAHRGRLALNEDRLIEHNLLLSRRGAQALGHDYDRYLAWLTERQPAESGNVSPGMIFVLGMHRSGTSCLTGALGACGCYLGDVDRSDPDNPPGGNIELPAVYRLNERILAASGGSWNSPPAAVRVQPSHQDSICALLASLRKEGVCAVKDPRMLLLAHAWLPVAGVCCLVGTFRHPLSVAASLARRDGISEEKALQLWCIYNSRLVELHKQFQFPLIEYQLHSPSRYLDELVAIASCLGLQVDRLALEAWVQPGGHSSGSDLVPRSCNKIFEYLRTHSVSGTTASNGRLRPLVFAPDAAVLYPSVGQSLRRLAYQSVHRLLLAYHRLPYGFRVFVRRAMGRRLPVPRNAVCGSNSLRGHSRRQNQ